MNTSRRNELSEVVELDLSKQEDNVTSLAIARSSEYQITAYAGINSSEAVRKEGKNEHLRSYSIDLPPKRKRDEEPTERSVQYAGKTEALGQVGLFNIPATKYDTYQRITRLSPPGENQAQRVCALATALAPGNEIVVLRANSMPRREDVLLKIPLQKEEAADLDIITPEDGPDHLLAYATDFDVYTQDIYLAQQQKPRKGQSPLIYDIPPLPEMAVGPGRPKLRGLRFLTSKHILLLQNLAGKAGAELLICKMGDKDPTGQIKLKKRLHKSIKVAVSMDVCKLSKSEAGEQQFVIAIAGQNGSIEILTIELNPEKALGKFTHYSLLKDVHPQAITKITWSTFIPPPMPVSSKTWPQYIKLASTSVSNTVVVHTFPLQPHPPFPAKTPRYVLTDPSGKRKIEGPLSIIIAILVVILSVVSIQAFSEIRGAVPSRLGATNYLPKQIQHMIARPYVFADDAATAVKEKIPNIDEIPVISTVKDTIADLVDKHGGDESSKAIIISDLGNDLSTEVHHDAAVAQKETLRKWEDLKEHEKKTWRQKLSKAGHWSMDEGESILKGVFFSELAGLVGDVIRG